MGITETPQPKLITAGLMLKLRVGEAFQRFSHPNRTVHRRRANSMATEKFSKPPQPASESIGVRYRFLLVKAVFFRDERAFAICDCDCGSEAVAALNNIRRGITQSCGCYRKATHTKIENHPKRVRPREFNSWHEMRQRCSNPKKVEYKNYGGRGIKVCERWQNSFDAFFADMGERPTGTSIDRWPDKDGNYEPGNCRWATRREQALNHRRNHLITFRGETLTITEWSERIGIGPGNLAARLGKLGWELEKALTTPKLRRYDTSNR